MTCGIYRLVFGGTDKCYIGQSVNIEYRYTQHLYKFKNRSAQQKLLRAYDVYGVPTLDILAESNRADLDREEKEAIEIFDSVENGFNTYQENRGRPPETRKCGEDSASSIYSNAQIEEAFLYLVDCQNMTALEISKETSISVHTIRAIAGLNQHKWLKLKFPEKYSILESSKGMSNKSDKFSAAARGIQYPAVISPLGVVYSNITNAKKFCEEHNLTRSNFGEVLNGRRKSHKGWRLNE